MAATRVLVIDDDADIRQMTQIALTRLGGMDVLEADGALAGVRLAEREHPDAILLDVMMPGIDGPEALRLLRENPQTSKTPVFFLTARTTDLDDQRLRRLGAQGLLAKPFDPLTLAQRVRELLAGLTRTEE